ncbi:glycosyltransferase [Patescibacteria group bacterium]|nr:glycosyltransferase [Patescibacteria group bacterium]
MNQSRKKHKTTPLVTVITPTYNRASFLEETIKSVLNQNYPNLEYIVLDDGSADNTIKILKKFDKKIIWRTHKNIGEVKTVNKGFLMAKGEIISVVNSDDPLLPKAVSSMVDVFINNPKIVVAYPDWIKIDGKGKELGKIKTPEYSYEYMLKSHDNITGPGTFFRKKILDSLKGRDSKFKYVSDYDFWLRAGLLGPFMRVPKNLATSRVHSGQLTLKDKGYKMAMEHINVLNKYYSLKGLPENIIKVRAEAYTKACEAARICRGNNPITKLVIFLVTLYYNPLYLKEFINFRLNKIR